MPDPDPPPPPDQAAAAAAVAEVPAPDLEAPLAELDARWAERMRRLEERHAAELEQLKARTGQAERDTDPDLPTVGRKRAVVDASKAVRPGRQVFGPSASGVYHHPTRKALKRVGGVAGVYPRSPIVPKPKQATQE